MSGLEIAVKITDHMGFSYHQILSENRKSKLVICRRMIALILHEKGHTLAHIGIIIRRHHTTVLHHIKVMQDHKSIYADLRNLYHELNKVLASYENQTEQSTTGSTEIASDDDDQAASS